MIELTKLIISKDFLIAFLVYFAVLMFTMSCASLLFLKDPIWREWASTMSGIGLGFVKDFYKYFFDKRSNS
jgi:hypothetical protein